MIELAIVLLLLGILSVPLLRLAAWSMDAARVQQTQAVLETARDALIDFAAMNGGCLPFAADFEGGLPDTDVNGVGGYDDTGVGKVDALSGLGNVAGDLPWADLGLTNSFLDGDNLRIQYYVASQYTDTDGDPATGIKCVAGHRGQEWFFSTRYFGTVSDPMYIYFGSGPNRRLYRITGDYFSGRAPPEEEAQGGPVANVTGVLPDDLLEVRRGPDVTGLGAQGDKLSERNVFVLIAPSENRNTDLGRSYVRDSNHRDDAGGSIWTVTALTTSVDDNVFSMTPNVDATDAGNDGDDAVLVMSFFKFKAALAKHGLNMELICETAC